MHRSISRVISLFLSFPSPSFFLPGLAALLLKTPWSQDNKTLCHTRWSLSSHNNPWTPAGSPHPCRLHSRPAILGNIADQATLSWKPLVHLITGTYVSVLGHSFFPVFKRWAISLHMSCALPKGPYVSPSLGHFGKNPTKALQGIRAKLMLLSKRLTYISHACPHWLPKMSAIIDLALQMRKAHLRKYKQLLNVLKHQFRNLLSKGELAHWGVHTVSGSGGSVISKMTLSQATSTSPGNLLGKQSLRSTPDAPKHNVHLNKIPMWSVHTLHGWETLL